MSQEYGGQDYLIFSAEGVYNGLYANELATAVLRNGLITRNIPNKEIKGCYKGVKETSFIVNAVHEPAVQEMCEVYEQECYMKLVPHIHGMYKVFFVYSDRRGHEFKGYLRSVSEEQALASDGYSYRPDMDTYWIITDNDNALMQ